MQVVCPAPPPPKKEKPSLCKSAVKEIVCASAWITVVRFCCFRGLVFAGGGGEGGRGGREAGGGGCSLARIKLESSEAVVFDGAEFSVVPHKTLHTTVTS